MYLKNIIEEWKNPLKFKTKTQVSKDEILKIIEAGRWSPSAGNQQVWRFLVIDDEKGKKKIIKSILNGDPRLTTTLQEFKKPVLQKNFIFSTENYNARTDKYKEDISKNYSDILNCAETASFFIICTHKNTLIGKSFGFVDMGGTIANMIIISYDLGYHLRWIRIFDRENIREKFHIPKSVYIDAIIAVGEADKLSNTPEYRMKEIKDCYFHNLWDEAFEENYTNSNLQDYKIEAIDAVVDRRSIRSYNENRSISNSINTELLKAGMMVPLTINMPYIKTVIIDNKNILRKIAKSARIITKQHHVQNVPLIYVITYDCSNNSPGFYAEIDSGAIIQNLLLRAHTLGIGTCWIGAFNRKIVKNVLQIPEDWHIPSIAIFGYPKKYPKPTPRLDIGKICYYNSWNKQIKKRQRTVMPDNYALSVSFRKLKKTRVNTILRTRRVGDIKGIPEFENL